MVQDGIVSLGEVKGWREMNRTEIALTCLGDAWYLESER